MALETCDMNLDRPLLPATSSSGRRLGRRRNRGCNSMVEYLPSKQATWVRFPSPAFTWGGQSGRGEYQQSRLHRDDTGED